MQIEPVTALAFSLFENRGVYAALLGSGLSRAAQIPTGWEITLDLVRRVAAAQHVADQPDWADWYRAQAGKEPNYSEVLDALSSSPDERRAILHHYIEPSGDDLREGRKVPTEAHRAVTWLVKEGFIRVVLTTNFDRLTETALRDVGVEPSVIRSEDDLIGAVPLIHSHCYVVKLHGDYLDTRIKNTDEELATYSPAMSALLDRILDEHGLIVCGWSGEWDHALRAAIAHAPNRRYPTFWAARGPVAPRANDLIIQRYAKLIPITDADAFFGNLRESVATQAEAQRPNPRSAELIVQTVKRYLARSEHRIQLHDLLADESRRLASRIGDPIVFVRSGPGSRDEYRARVRRYEAAAEILMRVFGVVGRWGDEPACDIVSEIIGDVARLEIEGGLNWWLDLRFYPAVLLFYAFGLGALKAGLYRELFKWYTQPVQRDQRNTQPFIERFVNWHSETQDQWKMLEGFEKNKTPLSDHLHDVTSVLVADISMADRAHARLFETFEILAALAFLTINASKDQLQQAHANPSNFVWSPVGRAGWDSSTRDPILAEIERPEIKQALLKAGFSGGDKDHFEFALESMRRLMGRMQW